MEKTEKKAVIKPKAKIIIGYIEVEGREKLSIITVNGKGQVSKTLKIDKEALPALKKFVSAL